ncbi:MAG TPA: hypothetical protein VI455_02100 [Terriglobia bacterium]
MPIVKSPALTAAKLAANRANARRSTEPRSYRGKCRVALNALRHGRCASSKLFRSRLVAGQEEVALYDWIYALIRDAVGPVGKPEWQEVEAVARQAWCSLARKHRWRPDRPLGGRPAGGPVRRPPTQCSVWCLLRVPRRLGSTGRPRYLVKASAKRVLDRAGHRIDLGYDGVYLKFWVRRRRERPDLGPAVVLNRAAWMAGAVAGWVCGGLGRFLGTLRNRATMLFGIKRCEN